MRTGRRLEETGDRGPDRSSHRRNDDGEQDVQRVVHSRERRPDPEPRDHADEVLALTADVEQAAAERKRDRQPREDQRRRQDQRLLEVVRRVARDRRVPPEEDVVGRERDVDVVVAEVEEPVQAGLGDDALVDLPGIVAGRGDEDAAHEEGEERRDDRSDDPAGALVDGEALRDARRVGGYVGVERFRRVRRLDVRPADVRPFAHVITPRAVRAGRPSSRSRAPLR